MLSRLLPIFTPGRKRGKPTHHWRYRWGWGILGHDFDTKHGFMSNEKELDAVIKFYSTTIPHINCAPPCRSLVVRATQFMTRNETWICQVWYNMPFCHIFGVLLITHTMIQVLNLSMHLPDELSLTEYPTWKDNKHLYCHTPHATINSVNPNKEKRITTKSKIYTPTASGWYRTNNHTLT